MIFSSASYEEFSFDFSTVSAAPPGVSADRLKFAVSERHGRTCSLVCIYNKNKIMIIGEILYGTNTMTKNVWNLASRNITQKKIKFPCA